MNKLTTIGVLYRKQRISYCVNVIKLTNHTHVHYTLTSTSVNRKVMYEPSIHRHQLSCHNKRLRNVKLSGDTHCRHRLNDYRLWKY